MYLKWYSALLPGYAKAEQQEQCCGLGALVRQQDSASLQSTRKRSTSSRCTEREISDVSNLDASAHAVPEE